MKLGLGLAPRRGEHVEEGVVRIREYTRGAGNGIGRYLLDVVVKMEAPYMSTNIAILPQHSPNPLSIHPITSYPLIPISPQIATSTRRDNPSRDHQPPCRQTRPNTVPLVIYVHHHPANTPASRQPQHCPLASPATNRVARVFSLQRGRRGLVVVCWRCRTGGPAMCMYRAVLYLLMGGRGGGCV